MFFAEKRGLGLAGIGLIMVIVATGCAKKHTEVHTEMRVLTAAVYASGTLVPENEYKVVSSVDGYLVQSNVKEGDYVRKGQLLFKVSSKVRNAQEYSARELVEKTIPVASSNSPVLKETKNRIELARLNVQQDSINYIRYKNLYAKDAVSKAQYEQYQLKYQTSKKESERLLHQYRQQNINADIQLQQAENQLIVATAQADVGLLKSFSNGKVYEVYKEEGDLVTPNQPIALVGEGDMIAKLLVDEDDLDKVYNKQKVLITMDAYPDKVFKAHIIKIYPLLNKVEQSFRVDAALDDVIPAPMYGLNLEANIVVEEKKPVMVIPKAALLKGDSVLIKSGKEIKRIKIEKGLEDENWVEVRGGLTNTSTVIIER